MKISTEFLPRGPNMAAEEAVTVARIRISVGEQVVTEMRVDQQTRIRDHIIAPAYPLAEAIAFRWWALIYGRGRTTNIRSMRAGFALPDITINPNGNELVEIRCVPYTYVNPPITFVTRASETLRVAAFEGYMKDFLNNVNNRLRTTNIIATPFDARLAIINRSIEDPEEYAFCRLAGAFGIDPYSCSTKDADFIERAAHVFEGDDLEEFLAGVDPGNASQAIDWLRNAEQQAEERTDLPDIGRFKSEISFRRTTDAPWTIGYQSARRVRQGLSFAGTEPIGNMGLLAERLGNPRFCALAQSRTGLRGVSRTVQGHWRAMVSGGGHPASELFAVARTIGDAIHFGSSRYSPVTSQPGTYRQQLNRAFAAELLAPADAVMEMSSGGEPVEEIASHFGVAEKVIEHQIENFGNARLT